MSWGAVVVGAALGVAYFGGLWLTTRRLLGGRGGWWLLPLSRWLRLALAGAAFYALSLEGAGAVLSGLAGLWLARGWLIRLLGGPGDGR
jgi:F1F0 ATPase subunit 2